MNSMKIRNDIDLNAFLKAVNTCERDVYYVSSEKDFLNLKSKLATYIFLIFLKDPELLSEGHVECDPVDLDTLSEFLL